MEIEPPIIPSPKRHSTDKIKNLQRKAMEMLKCQTKPASVLQQNLKRFYTQRKTVLCKMTYMIELNTEDWNDNEKKEFLTWFYRTLSKIAQNTSENRSN